MPPNDKTAKMLQFDLQRACIDYRTDEGVADFHSLRHTFISDLARGGVYAKPWPGIQPSP